MELINFVLSSSLAQTAIPLIKIFGTVFFFGSLVIFLFCLRSSPFVRLAFWQDFVEMTTQKALGIGKVEKKWAAIRKKLGNDNAADWKLAVLEAESLLEEVLARMGFGGDSFGERLKKITPEQLPSLDDLVQAHQTRNNIVHDPDYALDNEQAGKTVNIYGRCLQELNAL